MCYLHPLNTIVQTGTETYLRSLSTDVWGLRSNLNAVKRLQIISGYEQSSGKIFNYFCTAKILQNKWQLAQRSPQKTEFRGLNNVIGKYLVCPVWDRFGFSSFATCKNNIFFLFGWIQSSHTRELPFMSDLWLRFKKVTIKIALK